MTQVALTVFPGVSGDECEAFSVVLEQLEELDLVRVGATVGEVPGVGLVQHVDRTFDEVTHPDVVVVPGGLGCRDTARDSDLADWLRGVAPTCRWLVGSSTGTVVLAAAGLLDDHPVATHWLAEPLLASYGSTPATERIVEHGHTITCEGRVTAVDVALLLVVHLFGNDVARRVRSELAGPGRPGDDAARTRGLLAWLFDRSSAESESARPRNPELQVSDWVDEEVIEMEVGEPFRRA